MHSRFLSLVLWRVFLSFFFALVRSAELEGGEVGRGVYVLKSDGSSSFLIFICSRYCSYSCFFCQKMVSFNSRRSLAGLSELIDPDQIPQGNSEEE